MESLFSVSLFITLLYLFAFVIFGLLFYIIIRPFVLWYFKINQIKHLQEQNNILLGDILCEIRSARKDTNSVKTKEEDPMKKYEAYMPK